jgi:hypothetical protein
MREDERRREINREDSYKRKKIFVAKNEKNSNKKK